MNEIFFFRIYTRNGESNFRFNLIYVVICLFELKLCEYSCIWLTGLQTDTSFSIYEQEKNFKNKIKSRT